MITKRFDFNFRPLQINTSITTDGSVPDSQSYDADEDTYTPDYTVTPCAIMPRVSRIDRDGYLSAGAVNGDSANFSCKWSELINGKEQEIGTDNTNYQITTTGNNTGRILVKKNAKPGVPINLVFYCEYIDPRTKQIYRIKKPYQIPCRSETVYIPQLFLDAADQTIYNPLTDADTQTITPSLKLGQKECEASKRIFIWEVYREDSGVWDTPGSDESDYDIADAGSNSAIVVNKSLMGDSLTLRCRAKYSRDGNPSSVALNDSSPCKVIRFVRRIPKITVDFVGVPNNLPSGAMLFNPQAVIEDTNGCVDNPERYLLPIWSAATNGSGNLSFSQVATGMSPNISTDAMNVTNGAVYGLEAKDVGPIAVMLDSDGAAFVDPDGNYIMIK